MASAIAKCVSRGLARWFNRNWPSKRLICDIEIQQPPSGRKSRWALSRSQVGLPVDITVAVVAPPVCPNPSFTEFGPPGLIQHDQAAELSGMQVRWRRASCGMQEGLRGTLPT